MAISYNIWPFFAQNFNPLKETQSKYLLLELLIPLCFKLKHSSCFTIMILLESCNFLKEYLSKSPKIGINTSYLTDSYIGFTLKMESVSKNTTFALKMMVKSSLEKMISKFFHAGNYFLLLHKSAQDHKFSNINNDLPAWRDFKINFSRPLFTIIFRPKMVFLGTDSI